MAYLGKVTRLGGDLSAPTLAALSVTAFVVTSYLLYLYLLPKPLPGIPFNPEAKSRLLGDAPALNEYLKVNGEFSSWLGEQCLKLQSPVCQIFIQPFKLPWILVADFHEAQDILMRRSEFDKPQFLTDGLSTLGDIHFRRKTDSSFKTRRHLRQDLMGPKFLNSIVGPSAHKRGQELIQLFQSKVDLADGRPWWILEDYQHAAVDIMAQYAFGENFHDSALKPQLELLARMTPALVRAGKVDEPITFGEAHLSPFFEGLHQTADVMERTTISNTPQMSFWWWSHQQWYKDIIEKRKQVVPAQLKLAAQNLQSGKVTTALEHIMLREKGVAEKTGREPLYLNQMMEDEIFSDLMTGSHTTSSAMAWVTKYLSGYPYAQVKLREALYKAIPLAVKENRLPTFEEIRLAKIPYLEAVIEETRRLTPFVIVREAVQNTVILGHKIPRGCQVMMVSAGPGIMLPSIPVKEELRSPSAKAAKPWGKWNEAQDLKTFQPERWLKDVGDGNLEFDATSGPQLGFGMGARQCWGKRLAHLSVRTVMSLIVWKFEMLAVPEELGGYAGMDGISRQPVKAYVKFKNISVYDP